MKNPASILTDSFNRSHSYLRISISERCNLRCSYCMPNDVAYSPSAHLMNADELFNIAKLFVDHGVTKIRLTGGEPLLRKDFPIILERLATLPVALSMTTNAVCIDRFIPILKKCRMEGINVSLDTLERKKFAKIAQRDLFEVVYRHIMLLIDEDFHVKLNVVLMKGVNEEEIIPFIEFTKQYPVAVRFIEFMPFEGNQWNKEKTVSLNEILNQVHAHYGATNVVRLQDAPNDTAKNFKIVDFAGKFAVISTVTNPFCDQCNRLRLTANGRLKNCLFSVEESDLLTTYRAGGNIVPIIQQAVMNKHAVRAGMQTADLFDNLDHHQRNRSMIKIGG